MAAGVVHLMYICTTGVAGVHVLQVECVRTGVGGVLVECGVGRVYRWSEGRAGVQVESAYRWGVRGEAGVQVER